jgi:lipopolysaccharide transport system ATP-binding protein
MSEVAKEGRTVLFVSHNMGAVQQLCTKTCILENGIIKNFGETAEIIPLYMVSTLPLNFNEENFLVPNVRLMDFYLMQKGVKNCNTIDLSFPFELHVAYDVNSASNNLLLGFDLYSTDGTLIFRSYDVTVFGLEEFRKGKYESVFKFPENLLNDGRYKINLVSAFHRMTKLNKEKFGIGFTCHRTRTSDIDYPGIINIVGNWEVTKK